MEAAALVKAAEQSATVEAVAIPAAALLDAAVPEEAAT